MHINPDICARYVFTVFIFIFSSLAQTIQITQNTKDILERMGGFCMDFRCKMEVKVKNVMSKASN